MYTSTITQKGQVTIPKKLRDSLHLQTNDKIIFVKRNETLILKPVKVLRELRGSVQIETSDESGDIREIVKQCVTRKIADE